MEECECGAEELVLQHELREAEVLQGGWYSWTRKEARTAAAHANLHRSNKLLTFRGRWGVIGSSLSLEREEQWKAPLVLITSSTP